MLEKDSNSRLQLQVSRWPWIANEAPQLATLKFSLGSHFLTYMLTKMFQEWLFCSLHDSNACLDKNLLWGKLASHHLKLAFLIPHGGPGQIHSGMQGPIGPR